MILHQLPLKITLSILKDIEKDTLRALCGILPNGDALKLLVKTFLPEKIQYVPSDTHWDNDGDDDFVEFNCSELYHLPRKAKESVLCLKINCRQHYLTDLLLVFESN